MIILIFLTFGILDVVNGKVIESSQSTFFQENDIQVKADGKTFMLAIENSIFPSQASASNLVTSAIKWTTSDKINHQIYTEKCTIEHFQSV